MSNPNVPPEFLLREGMANMLNTNFNQYYAANQSTGFYPGAPAMTIDWGATSKNFFRARISPEDIIKTGNFTFPLACVYAIAAVDGPTQKFQEFAGSVSCGLEFHLSGKKFSAITLLNDFETWADCVTKTILQMINSPLASIQSMWPAGVLYGGGIRYDRLPVRMAAENWLQTIKFTLPADVVIRP